MYATADIKQAIHRASGVKGFPDAPAGWTPEDARELADADGLYLSEAHWDVIRALQQPVLGICLGMQLLADASEEEDVDCLGIIPGVAQRLPVAEGFPVPNMGWCPITRTADAPLLAGIEDGSYFYFVHSYALPPSDFTLATARHTEPFSAVIGRGNFVASQFHPERSSGDGARLLQNFLESAR